MENQNGPFLNLNPTPQTPPPASKKKLILMVAGLLAVSGLTYMLAGSNLFKGQLLLSEKNDLEMSKIADYVKPFSQGDDQWGLKTGQEESFEVLENAPTEVLFWSKASAGDWKVLHADFTTLLDQETPRKITVTDLSNFKNTDHVSSCINFGDGTPEVCNNNPAQEKTFEHVYERAGEFPITMTAFDGEGFIDAQTKVVTFEATDEEKGLHADYELTIDSDNYLEVTLIDTSDEAGVIRRCVSFGDDKPIECSRPLSEKKFKHTYDEPGTYGVLVSVFDEEDNKDVELRTITITERKLFTADFALNPYPNEINKIWIRDTSVIDKTEIMTRCVNFGDGTADVCEPNFNLEMNIPTDYEHTYVEPGDYNITLTLTDVAGRVSTKTQAITIESEVVVDEPIETTIEEEVDESEEINEPADSAVIESEAEPSVQADFTVTATPTAENPYIVFIDHNSTAKNTVVSSINIDYGDGNKAEGISVNGEEDGTHVYNGPGTYTITLTAFGGHPLARDTVSRTITLEAPVSDSPAEPEPTPAEPVVEPQPEPELESDEVPDAPQAPEQEEPSEPSDLSASVLSLLFADTLSIGEENIEINYVVAKQGASVYFAALCEEGPDLVHITPITTEDIEATIQESDASNTASLDIEEGTVGCNKLSASEVVTNENAENPEGDSVIDPIDDEEVIEELEEEFDDFEFENDEDEDYGDDYGSNDDDFDFDDSDDSSEYEETECSDYVDNDGDSYIDIEEDPGCESLDDDDESNPVLRTTTECSDEKDNDGDGFKDTEDPGCQNAKDDDETNEEEVVQSDEVDLPACFAATDSVHTFTDIDELDSTYVIDTEANAAYVGRVKNFHGEPIFKGYGSNGSRMFKPYAPIRRDEAVKTVLLTTCYLDHLSYNGELDVNGVSFKDSEFKIKDYWAKELIYIATNAGLVENDDQFIPSGQVTRAEYLKMLLTAYSEITGNDIAECSAGDSQFIDVDASDWYCKYGVLAKELGISEGYVDAKGELRLNPKKVLTRSDAAIMLWNYYIAVENSDLDLEEANNAGGRILR